MKPTLGKSLRGLCYRKQERSQKDDLGLKYRTSNEPLRLGFSWVLETYSIFCWGHCHYKKTVFINPYGPICSDWWPIIKGQNFRTGREHSLQYWCGGSYEWLYYGHLYSLFFLPLVLPKRIKAQDWLGLGTEGRIKTLQGITESCQLWLKDFK